MVAGVVEHLDRPMAVESAVDSGFLVDTSPSLPRQLACFYHCGKHTVEKSQAEATNVTDVTMMRLKLVGGSGL